MKYCVYSRCFFENNYLNYFIQHYINLGFDKIIILHSGGSEYTLSKEHEKIVDIHYLKNEGNILVKKNDYLIKNSNYDWILQVDNDELLILNNNYENINDYVKEKLLINNQINAFYFRWGMIEKFDNENNNNFSYILNKYKIFPNSHIKTMFKKKDLLSVDCTHHVSLNNLTVYFENNIFNSNQAIHPINENSYNDHILIHLHTRSLNNLILKSFYTLFSVKKIDKKKEFIDFINLLEKNELTNDTFLNDFILFIGAKANLPFFHIKEELICMKKFNILKCNYEICNPILNLEDILTCLKNNNINENNYFYFINKLSEKIINDKLFIK